MRREKNAHTVTAVAGLQANDAYAGYWCYPAGDNFLLQYVPQYEIQQSMRITIFRKLRNSIKIFVGTISKMLTFEQR